MPSRKSNAAVDDRRNTMCHKCARFISYPTPMCMWDLLDKPCAFELLYKPREQVKEQLIQAKGAD